MTQVVEKVTGNGADEMINMVGGHRPQGAAPLQAGHRVRPGVGFLIWLQSPSPLPGPRLPEYSLCMHSPSVQFLESSRVPLQSRPPFWGGGAMHSRLRQWAHSVLQADHLLHSVHAPSTVGAQHIAHGNTHVQTHTQICARNTAMYHADHTENSAPYPSTPRKCRVKRSREATRTRGDA